MQLKPGKNDTSHLRKSNHRHRMVISGYSCVRSDSSVGPGTIKEETESVESRDSASTQEWLSSLRKIGKDDLSSPEIIKEEQETFQSKDSTSPQEWFSTLKKLGKDPCSPEIMKEENETIASKNSTSTEEWFSTLKKLGIDSCQETSVAPTVQTGSETGTYVTVIEYSQRGSPKTLIDGNYVDQNSIRGIEKAPQTDTQTVEDKNSATSKKSSDKNKANEDQNSTSSKMKADESSYKLPDDFSVLSIAINDAASRADYSAVTSPGLAHTRTHRCARCHKPISGTPEKLNAGGHELLFHNACFELGKCSRCHKRILLSDKTSELGAVGHGLLFHEECLEQGKCVRCHKSILLSETPERVHAGNIELLFHKGCFTRKKWRPWFLDSKKNA